MPWSTTRRVRCGRYQSQQNRFFADANERVDLAELTVQSLEVCKQRRGAEAGISAHDALDLGESLREPDDIRRPEHG